ncbi:O-methyltransferase [Corynebacterium kozikiae]|uniref:O-methyltransferase n=1 Tax=Corynebacterium kozikiae TaxID=2968469 RepID=UPI00211C639A|nr:O-methyltransferase [Corynebacterium sp. 76QC2CO]
MSAQHPSDVLREYIESTTSPSLEAALEDAAEFGLPTPDAATGTLLSSLAALTKATGAIAVTPTASVIGLYLLAGMAEGGILTCIDPEADHQKRAKATFRDAGYSPSRVRFLPSRPLDVMGRLAHGSYNLVYGEIAPLDLKAFVDAALPLLAPGGAIVLADALLDGTLADETRKDRDTVAAREADQYFQTLEGVHVSRLPIGAGTTLIVKP